MGRGAELLFHMWGKVCLFHGRDLQMLICLRLLDKLVHLVVVLLFLLLLSLPLLSAALTFTLAVTANCNTAVTSKCNTIMPIFLDRSAVLLSNSVFLLSFQTG